MGSKKNGRKKSSSSSSGSASVTAAPEEVIRRAETLASAGHFESAERLLQRVLAQTPDNIEALELLMEALFDLGETQRATSTLHKLIDAQKARGLLPVPEHFMYLGQLSTGRVAVQHFSSGIAAWKAAMQPDTPLDPAVQRRICSAYCSICDIFMTDLCFEPDAEAQCERCCQEALEVNPEGIEVLQTLASVRISQQRQEEARKCVLRSLEKWHRPIPKHMLSAAATTTAAPADEDEIAGREEEGEDIVDAVAELEAPDFDFRMQTAKLLMEVGEHDKAVELLERLLLEDDLTAGVWYLLAACHEIQGQHDEAVECALYALKIVSQSDYEQDPCLVEQVEQLAEALQVDKSLVSELPEDFVVKRLGTIDLSPKQLLQLEEADDDDDGEESPARMRRQQQQQAMHDDGSDDADAALS